MSVSVNAANNRINGFSYDSSGNLTAMTNLTMTYDVENRLVQSVHSSNGTESYVYDQSNQRVWKQTPSRTMVYFYSVDGTVLATYGNGSNSDYNVYFAGKQIWEEGSAGGRSVWPDRLGSLAAHFPYGDEPSTTTQDRVKFATYYRDSTSTLDYARNRYYSRAIGRFTTPDPYGGSAKPGNPQSWNRYAYAGNDPVNFNDPGGLDPWWVPNPEDSLPGYGGGGGWWSLDIWGLLPWEPFPLPEIVTDPTPMQQVTSVLGGLANSRIVSRWWGSESDSLIIIQFSESFLSSTGIAVPYPGDVPLWVITVTELAKLLARSTAAGALFALTIAQVGDGSPNNLPRQRCPKGDDFWKTAKSPGKGWEWRGNPRAPVGSRLGAWHNPATGESLHPDVTHLPGKPPHWTYTDPRGNRWECYEDGKFKRILCETRAFNSFAQHT